MWRFFDHGAALAALVLAAGTPGGACAQAAATSLQAVDSLGRAMGRIGLQTGTGSMSLRLWVDSVSTWVPLEAAQEGGLLAFRAGGVVLFTDPDCAGAAWLAYGSRGAGTRASTLVTGGGRQLLYVADGARTSDKLITHQFDGTECRSYTYGARNHRQPVWRASSPPVDLGALYAPPFTIR
jgi:hypothetical protein